MNKQALILIFTTAIFTANAAGASSVGWYLGVGLGQGKAKEIEDNLDDFLRGLEPLPADLDITISSDDKSTTWKLLAGYRINKNLAVEGGYANFGEFKYSGSYFIDNPSSLPDFSGAYSGKTDTKIWALSALGFLPVGMNFELFGKLGAAFWDMKTTEAMLTTVDQESESWSRSVSKNGTGLNFGLGVVYHANKKLSLRAEWERFKDVGKNEITGESDIELLSLGVMFSF